VPSVGNAIATRAPRFGAFKPSQQPPRSRAPGLGGEAGNLPAEDLGDLEATTPIQGFTGILGRSRFASFLPPPVLGHNGFVYGGSGAKPEPDPNTGDSQFDAQAALYDANGVTPYSRTSDMPASNEALTASGLLRYVRRTVDTTNPGTRAPDMVRWGDPPFPRAFRQLRYTLRREFLQGAQNFLGQHTMMLKKGAASTSPVRMGPPRTNRLTSRAATGSYGQQTEVLGA
jgi:hypothetical protein